MQNFINDVPDSKITRSKIQHLKSKIYLYTMNTIPDSFWNLQKSTKGWEEEKYREVLNTPAPVSIRLNPGKFPRGLTGKSKVLWEDHAFYLPERPVFTIDPWWHAGAYYVQEASSMFSGWLVQQLGLEENAVVLDLCAAPGGKSTHLSSVLPSDALLVSNEVIQQRVSVLNENCTKWGYANIITNNDPSHFSRLTGVFDLIVVDAPCSGEGLFRRDPDSVKEWSPENVQLCCERQQRILAQIWPALKEGGYLIYSTCTYNTKEDEENLEWLRKNCEAESVDIQVPSEWEIYSPEKGAFKFFPWKTKGEGFFVTVVRKTSEEPAVRFRSKGLNIPKGKHPMQEWLKGSYSLVDMKERIIAVPTNHQATIELLQQNLKVVRSGIELGSVKGKDLIPSVEAALAVDFNIESFPILDLDYETSIAYLKRELNDLPDTENGWTIVSYQDLPLGFVKKIGNRINNYFPQEWRLRMAVTNGEEAITSIR